MCKVIDPPPKKPNIPKSEGGSIILHIEVLEIVQTFLKNFEMKLRKIFNFAEIGV